MLQKTLGIALAMLLTLGLGVAQESNSEKKIVIKKSTSSSTDGGKTRTYVRVLRDGKVVEESGDASLLEEIDLPDLGKVFRFKVGDGDVRIEVGGDGDVATKSRSRRIVMKDGKKIVDEATEDGKSVSPADDLHLELRLPADLGGILGGLKIDRDSLIDLGSKALDRRIVIKDGKIDTGDLLRGLHIDIEALPGNLGDLLKSVKGNKKSPLELKKSGRDRLHIAPSEEEIEEEAEIEEMEEEFEKARRNPLERLRTLKKEAAAPKKPAEKGSTRGDLDALKKRIRELRSEIDRLSRGGDKSPK